MGDITTNFSYWEFGCHCAKCHLSGGNYINHDLVSKLQLIRDCTAIPMVVSSGCRCTSYNRVVGGVLNSIHLDKNGCRAADIYCSDSSQRHQLVKGALDLKLTVGITSDFLHFDTRKSKPRIFLY